MALFRHGGSEAVTSFSKEMSLGEPSAGYPAERDGEGEKKER